MSDLDTSISEPYANIIVIKRNGGDGSKFPLVDDVCYIGRHEDSDIKINLPHVSKKHLKLYVNNEGNICIQNLSKDGQTALNDTLLSQSQTLEIKNNDVFTVGGDRSFRVEYGKSSANYKFTHKSRSEQLDNGDITMIPLKSKVFTTTMLPKKSPLKSIENIVSSNNDKVSILPTPINNAIHSKLPIQNENIVSTDKENDSRFQSPVKSVLIESLNNVSSIMKKSALKSPIVNKKLKIIEYNADTSLEAIFSVINQAPSPAPTKRRTSIVGDNFASMQSYTIANTPTKTYTMNKKEFGDNTTHIILSRKELAALCSPSFNKFQSPLPISDEENAEIEDFIDSLAVINKVNETKEVELAPECEAEKKVLVQSSPRRPCLSTPLKQAIHSKRQETPQSLIRSASKVPVISRTASPVSINRRIITPSSISSKISLNVSAIKTTFSNNYVSPTRHMSPIRPLFNSAIRTEIENKVKNLKPMVPSAAKPLMSTHLTSALKARRERLADDNEIEARQILHLTPLKDTNTQTSVKTPTNLAFATTPNKPLEVISTQLSVDFSPKQPMVTPSPTRFRLPCYRKLVSSVTKKPITFMSKFAFIKFNYKLCFRNSFLKHQAKPLHIIKSSFSKAPILAEDSDIKEKDLMGVDVVEQVNSNKLLSLPTPIKESINTGIKLAPKKIGLSLPTPLKNTIKEGLKLNPKKIGESLPLELKEDISSAVSLKPKEIGKSLPSEIKSDIEHGVILKIKEIGKSLPLILKSEIEHGFLLKHKEIGKALPTMVKTEIESAHNLKPKVIGKSMPTPIKKSIVSKVELKPKKIGQTLPVDIKHAIESKVELKPKVLGMSLPTPVKQNIKDGAKLNKKVIRNSLSSAIKKDIKSVVKLNAVEVEDVKTATIDLFTDDTYETSKNSSPTPVRTAIAERSSKKCTDSTLELPNSLVDTNDKSDVNSIAYTLEFKDDEKEPVLKSVYSNRRRSSVGPLIIHDVNTAITVESSSNFPPLDETSLSVVLSEESSNFPSLEADSAVNLNEVESEEVLVETELEAIELKTVSDAPGLVTENSVLPAKRSIGSVVKDEETLKSIIEEKKTRGKVKKVVEELIPVTLNEFPSKRPRTLKQKIEIPVVNSVEVKTDLVAESPAKRVSRRNVKVEAVVESHQDVIEEKVTPRMRAERKKAEATVEVALPVIEEKTSLGKRKTATKGNTLVKAEEVFIKSKRSGRSAAVKVEDIVEIVESSPKRATRKTGVKVTAVISVEPPVLEVSEVVTKKATRKTAPKFAEEIPSEAAARTRVSSRAKAQPPTVEITAPVVRETRSKRK